MEELSLVLRAASVADAAVLEALAREADLSFLADRDLARPDGLALVAMHEGSVVGFIAGQIVVDEAEILDLVTMASWRGRGVGQRLLGDFLKATQARGVVRVLLEVRRTNGAAISLYERAGFVQVGERLRYYKDGEDALLFSSTLPIHSP
jgi:ribosomal-protein-alanine N-acetyltransferase